MKTPRRGQLWTLLADPALREQIAAADVVVGADALRTGKFSVFFGVATMERRVKTGKGLKARIVTVPVDFATDDVEVLSAFCVTQKGSCCYNRRQDINPGFN